MNVTTIQLDNSIYAVFYRAISLASKPIFSCGMSAVFKYEGARLILDKSKRCVEIITRRNPNDVLASLVHSTGIDLLEAEVT